MNEVAPEVPASVVDVENADPYPFYEQVREQGCPVRDGKLGAWLVGSYKDVSRVLKEEDTFSFHPTGPGTDAPHDTTLIKVHGGSLRRLVFLRGAEHRQLHRWWLDVFAPSNVDGWRESLIREVVDSTFDRILPQGRAELWADVAQRIPVRAICAVMGLPHDDDAYVERAASIIDVHGEYFNRRPDPGPELTQRAVEAVDEFWEMLEPRIAAGRDADSDDIVARLWRDGAAMFPDWDAHDVFAQLHNMFLGGKDTTTLGIANALHTLLTHPGLVEELRAEPDRVRGFVEETLRLDPPSQFRLRHARTDAELGGGEVLAGDRVVPLLAAANRDPETFECPADIRTERRSVHLAFGYGPRRCVGANLARAEIQEVIARIATDMPDVALDPAAAPPTFPGRMLRAHQPLHVTFTARDRAQV